MSQCCSLKWNLPSHPPGPGSLSSPPSYSFWHKCSSCNETHDFTLTASTSKLNNNVHICGRQTIWVMCLKRISIYDQWKITSLNKETCWNIKVNICTIMRRRETTGHRAKWIQSNNWPAVYCLIKLPINVADLYPQNNYTKAPAVKAAALINKLRTFALHCVYWYV